MTWKIKDFKWLVIDHDHVVIRKRGKASSHKLEAEVETKKLTGQADGNRQVIQNVI